MPGASAPAGSPVAPSPLNVVGLSQTQVEGLLGAPAQRANRGPGEAWTYRGSNCSVQVAFYYDVARNGFFALSQRAADPASGEAADCLARIHNVHAS